MADNPINKNNIDDAKEYLKTLLDITDVSRDITEYFKDVLKNSNLSRVTQAEILNINKQISRTILDQADNIERVLENRKSTKDITKDIQKSEDLIKKTEKERIILSSKLNELEDKRSQALASNNDALFDSLSDQIKQYDSINKKLENQQKLLVENKIANEEALKISKEVDKLSKSGSFKVLEKIVKATPGLKAFGSTFEKATEASRGAVLSGGGGLMAGLKELIGPLTKMSFIFGGVASILKFIVDAMFGASKLTAQFKRDFIVSSEEAEKVRQRTYDIAFNSKNLADTEGKILITQTQIVKSLEQANQALGVQMDLTSTLGEYGQQLLTQTAILRDNFGLSEEAIAGVTQESIRTGKTTEQITKNLTGGVAAIFLEKKLGADFNKILEQAYKTSGVLRLSFKGSSDEIAKGIAKLQLMGLTLQDTQKIAAGLLDFESSISAQIAAELLTGKQIYLERARLYALNRDFVGVGKELINQGITYNYLQTLNSEALEAQAKVFNLTGDELSDIIKKQEESNALSERAAKFGVKIKDINKQSLLDLYEANKNLLTSQEDLAKILGEEIYSKKQSEDAQAQFNKQLEKAKDIFSSFVSSGALENLSNALTNFAKAADSFFGNQGLKKQALGETEVTYSKSVLGTGLLQTTDTVSKETGMVLTEVKPLAFLGETLGDMFKYAELKDKQGKTIESSFGSDAFEKLLEQQKQMNEYLRQQANKSTDIILNGEKVTNGFAKQTYALGSGN
jgi:hypothetical protein